MQLPSRLRSRISLLVALGALLVAAGVTALLINTIDLRNSARETPRADAYLLRVLNVEKLLVDAETGLRGDAATGRTLFLAPLYSARAQFPAAFAALRQSAAENHAFQAQSEGLIAAVQSYMSGYAQNVLRVQARDPGAARSLSLTLEGKRLVDAIRTRVANLETLISGSQSARQAAARDTASRSLGEAIFVLVLLTLLTLALGGYLGRLVVQRERARERSEETTRTLQESVLPAELPEIPGCEVATRFIPGAGAVSGDFYDVLEDGHGGWAVLIGDVCGKGAAAAAATAMARWTLRSSLRQGAAPADALRFLNEVALGHESDGRFITAACMRIIFEAGAARVAIACAGHPAPILVPSEGTPEPVNAEGDLLGIMPTIRLHTAEVRLAPGDSLVAYTDGVTDQGPEIRRSPHEALGERSANAGAEELATIVEDLAHQPVGRHPDDVAIVALRYLRLDGEPTSTRPGREASLEGVTPV